MNSIIKKCLLFLLSFVMVVTSTPSYTFATTTATAIESGEKAGEKKAESKSKKTKSKSVKTESLSDQLKKAVVKAASSTSQKWKSLSGKNKDKNSKSEVVEETYAPFMTSAPEGDWKELTWLKEYYQSVDLKTDTWTTDSIVVPNDKALIMLSHVKPSEYYNKKININPSGGNTTFHIASDTSVTYGEETFSFRGLCAGENSPYQGTLSVTGVTFMTDAPLFGYLSDKAELSGKLKFTHRYHTTRPLLAEKVVHQAGVADASKWSVEVYTETVGQSTGSDSNPIESEYHVGGLVGTIGESAKLELSFANYSGKDGTAALCFTFNEVGGVFAGELASGAALTVTYSEKQASSVIGNVTGFAIQNGVTQPTTEASIEANVGALVGSMAKNSTLVLKNAISFTGSVSAAKGNAGGLVGSMAEGSSIELSDHSLTIQSNISTADGDVGGLVGNMAEDSSIALANRLIVEGNVSTTDGSAGGLIGSMADKSSIELKNDLTITGNVTVSNKSTGGDAGGLAGSMGENSTIELENGGITMLGNISTANGNAGGLIGYMGNGQVLFDADKKVTIKDNTIKGSGGIGGLFGYYAINQNMIYEQSYIVNNVTISGGGNAGGLFGVLWNMKKNTMEQGVKFEISNPDVSTKYEGGNGAYGGLIGCYKADDLSAMLYIHDTSVPSVLGGNASFYGGMIGKVAKHLDNTGDEGYSYIQMDDIVLNLKTNYSWVSYAYGGVIGMVENGHLINLGNATVSSDSFNGSNCGGLIGEMQISSVLRLHGTTNLCAVQNLNEPQNEWQYRGQLVGYRTQALIYAVGSGNDDKSETKDYWRFIRMSQRNRISDVGSYGEILRLDGVKLMEHKLTEGKSLSSAFEDKEIIQFSPSLHKVIFYQADSGSIASPRDFGALSIYIQQEGSASAEGCFSFAEKNESLSVDKKAVSGAITLTADIDMSGTGIFGLMRSNDSSRSFAGSLDGGNHTLTLQAGELFGITSGSSVMVDLSKDVSVDDYETKTKNNSNTYRGCGEIYNQAYLGLFSRMEDATIQNLSVKGFLHFDAAKNMYASVIAGEIITSATVTASSISVFSNVVYGGEPASSDMYASGYFGKVGSNVNLIFDECKWSGSLRNYISKEEQDKGTFNGGFIAYVNPNSSSMVTVRMSSCAAINGIIEDKSAAKNVRDGILVGEINDQNSGNKFNQFIVEGLTLENVKVSTCASKQSAGLLSYGMKVTDFDVTGLLIKNCDLIVDGKNAIFGGLATTATGYWKIHQSENYDYGIKFSGTNNFQGKSGQTTGSTGSTSGLLIACGQDKDKRQAIYLEVGADSYVIDDGSVVVDISEDYFDEFVGNTINTDQKGSEGIVSISVTDRLNETSAYVNRTYKKTETGANGPFNWKNNATRYYYNLDRIRFETLGGDQVRDLSDGIFSGEDLLCFSVFYCAASNIDKYFALGSSVNNKINGDIDLRGLSFYPLEPNTTLSFDASNPTTIIFGYDDIHGQNDKENSIKLHDSGRQHYRMQYGLFSQFDANGSNQSLNVCHLTLQGSVGYDEKYCGALICGDTVKGSYNSSTIYKMSLNLSDVVLDGIHLYDFEESEKNEPAPLLIHSIGEYTDLTIKKLRTTNKYTANSKTSPVATSLIGTVGSNDAKLINLSFEDIALDGRSNSGNYVGTTADETYGTCNSIFTKAILLHSFQYMSGSGQYNFKSSEKPNVTYGREISNTNEGTVSGRNNGLQYQYYDGGYVENPWTDQTDSDLSSRFANGFLPYVYLGEAANGTVTYHELDINLKIDFFEEGCGTYGDPYIVKNGMQLERLAAYINDETKLNGMKLRVNPKLLESQAGTSAASKYDCTPHVTYVVEGGAWKLSDSSDSVSDDLEEKLRSYLRNAYYMITADTITLGTSGGYYGIGNASMSVKQGRYFSGVIVGQKREDGSCPTIKIEAPDNPDISFAGLVSAANGCVIKDLVLDYSKTTIEINGSESDNTNSLDQVSFFGGVIGRVLGGDNIIDNVTVKYKDPEEAQVIVTEKNKSKHYAYLAAVGGYVGMVGWDYRGGGGVIFRNMPKDSYLQSVKIGEEPVKVTQEYEYEEGKYNHFYYANPYVGRVTDAYVCYEQPSADLPSLNNTDKNYSIPTLSVDDKLTVGKWYQKGKKGSDNYFNAIDVSVGSSQQLWILSAIVNSGASAMNCDCTEENIVSNSGIYYGGDFGNDDGLAYNYGKVRYGEYENIGNLQGDAKEPEEEQWWSGKTFENAKKVSYLVKEYTKLSSEQADLYHTFPAAHLSGNGARVDISITGNCDMRNYGNGFRGVGASYNIYSKTAAKYRNLVIQDFTANDNVVTLAMSDHEYYEEANDGDNDNKLRCLSSALFPMVYLSYEDGDKGLKAEFPQEIKEIQISGVVTKDFYKLEGSKSIWVPASKEVIFTGGLIGTIKRNDSNKPSYLSIDNVLLNDLTIKGGYDSGGIIAYMSGDTSKNIQFLSCNIQNMDIEAGVCTGGYVGAYTGGTGGSMIAVNRKLYGKSINDQSTSVSVVSGCSFANLHLNGDTCEGGLIGYCKGTTDVTDVKILSSFLGIGESDQDKNIYIGGLTGIQGGGKSLAENITVSDCTFSGKSNKGALGGMVGHLNAEGSYKNCYVVGDLDSPVTMSNAPSIGGMIGYKNSSSKMIIESCKVSGAAVNGVVMEEASNIGGMIGYIKSGSPITVSGCQIVGEAAKGVIMKNASNNTVNIGGIIGYMNGSGTTTIKNSKLVGEEEQGISLRNTSNKESNIGGLVGLVTSGMVAIESCQVGKNIENSVVMETISSSNTANVGGMVGRISSDKQISIIDGLNQHVTAAIGSGNLGGVVGFVDNWSGNLAINESLVDQVTLLGKNVVGGMVGYSNAQSCGISISDSMVKNSKIVTALDNRYDRASSGSVGGLLGAGQGTLKGYNILLRSNICGYQLKEGAPDDYFSSASRYETLMISQSINQRMVDEEVSLDKAKKLTDQNIGLKDVGPYTYDNEAVKYENTSYTDMLVFIPYSNLSTTGIADANSDKPYRFTAGNIGCWVGRVTNTSDELQLVGISKKGNYLPNADVGYYQSTTGGTLIYGDYKDSVASKTNPTEGETSPYITTNPVSDVLTGLYTTANGSKKLSLTGDAAVFADKEQKTSMTQQILADYKAMGTDQWNNIYGNVGKDVYAAFDTGGKYADKLSDYQKAEASESTKAGCDTFPILIVDTMDTDEITEIINDYVSVVTNSTQTRASHSYKNMEITTFRWDTNHFTCYDSNGEKITPSLKWFGGDYKQVRAVNGRYDNSCSQFTLVDVQFASPVTSDSSVFHIYVPVLVKKVLPFNMYVAATNGTNYQIEPYDQLKSTVIASHGENVTYRLTYQYLRTKEEWENSVNGGDNYLWKFDKSISLGGANELPLPQGTWLAMVDANDGGKMYDFTVKEANRLPKNVLTFSDAFPSWYKNKESYFCERLPLEAKEDKESGEMVVTTKDKDDATVLVKGTYYRPYDGTKDTTDAVRYHITCTAEDQTTGDFNGYVEVSETYFLTIRTPQNADQLIYAPANYVSIRGGMPIQKNIVGVTKGSENMVVIGNFFAQTNVTVTTTSNTNDKLTDEMPTASGTMEVSVDFNGSTDEEKSNNREQFNQNASAVGALWQQFSMQMKEYDGNKKSKLFTIPWNTMISVSDVEISYTDADKVKQTIQLSSEEYEKMYSVSQESKANFESLNVLNYLKASTTGVTIRLKFDVTFSEEGLKELPKRVSDAGTEGVAIKGLSKIAYQQAGLANAAAKDGEGLNHYWSSKDASASLVYEANEYDTGLSNGFNSQLGINALEDVSASMITSGFYDMSVLQNIETANGIHYTLQLLRKVSDNVNGNTYEVVDMRNYLSNVTIADHQMEGNVTDLSTGIQGAYGKLVYNEQNNCAELYLDWDGSAHTDDRIWNVPVMFDVYTGWEGNDTRYYSNYKVVLHVELGTFTDSAKTAMNVLQDSGAEDYIIYTNAKIYTGIVPATSSSQADE